MDVCFCNKYSQIVCENNHEMCHQCIIKFNKCKECNKELSLSNFIFPFKENKSLVITENIYEFVKEWKRSNFLRRRNESFFKYLKDNDLEILKSLKYKSKYTLYRGCNINFGNKYIDKFPSSWSRDLKTAKIFGKYIYKIEIDPDFIFLDLEFIKRDNRYEYEVILFQGEYECEFFNSYEIKQEIVYDDEIKIIFKEENKELILNTRNKKSRFCFTKAQLFEICDKYFIQSCKYYDKRILIENIIREISKLEMI